MFLHTLADVCRLSGLPVVEVPGWRTRSTEEDGLTRLAGVIWHHTATPDARAGDYPSLGIVRDGRSDLRGPLSHLGLGRSGTLYVIAAGQASHAGRGSWGGLLGNEDTLGIEMESAGAGGWTAAQRAAMPLLARALTLGLGIAPSRHIAHFEWAPTRKIDPKGVDMDALRRAAAEQDLDMALDKQDLKDIAEAVWAYGLSAVAVTPTQNVGPAAARDFVRHAASQATTAAQAASAARAETLGLRTALTTLSKALADDNDIDPVALVADVEAAVQRGVLEGIRDGAVSVDVTVAGQTPGAGA